MRLIGHSRGRTPQCGLTRVLFPNPLVLEPLALEPRCLPCRPRIRHSRAQEPRALEPRRHSRLCLGLEPPGRPMHDSTARRRHYPPGNWPHLRRATTDSDGPVPKPVPKGAS